jgi:acetyltransferase
VGILSGGGGFGVLGADACEKLNLEVVPLSHSLYEKLDALLPSYWSRGNPVDTAGAAVVNPLLVYPCLKAIIEDENIDAVLALACIGLGTLWPQEEKGQEEKEVSCLSSIFELMDRLRKPLITSMMVSEAKRRSAIFTTVAQYGAQVYPTPQRAVRVLAHLVEYSEYLRGGKAGATSPHHP